MGDFKQGLVSRSPVYSQSRPRPAYATSRSRPSSATSCSPTVRRRFAAATPSSPSAPSSAPARGHVGRGQRARKGARRGRSPRQREAHRERPPAAAARHATHDAPHVRLGHAPGHELRRALRTEPGRAHRLHADDGTSTRSYSIAASARTMSPSILLADAQETLYGAQPGEFSPLFSPPSDFWPLGGHCPQHLRLALTLRKRTMGAAGFEPPTSRV